jgi:type VI secretion system secreted protein Hcp
MALNAYLKLKGQKSGEINGSVTQKGREGKIMVIAVSHDVSFPL